MAITEVIEFKGSSGKKLVQQDQYLVPAGTRKRYFQVVLDDPATPHSEIYAHPDIPKLFEPHPDDDGLICKGIDPEQRDDDESYIVDVTVDYDDQYNGSETEDAESNHPLDRPVIISGVVNEYDQIVVRDVNGTLIRNSAKQAFDPPVTRKAGGLRFAMTKNYAALNLPLLRAYKNAINSDIWNGFAAGTVRIANIGFNKEVEPVVINEDGDTMKFVYWQISFEFELAEEDFGSDGTWKKYQLDQGFDTYNSGTGKWTAIKDDSGNPVNTAKPLNGSGAIGNPASPYWLSFDLYRPLPFAALGLL